VAAIATGEFAFDARWLRRTLLETAELDAPDNGGDTLARIASSDGAAEISRAVDQLAHDPGGRTRLYPRLQELIDGCGETMGRWAPLMVQGEHVAQLNDFVALTGRLWKLVDELSKEQVEDREIPLGEDWVAGRIAKLIDLAAHLEVEFDAEARSLSPLDHWIGYPDWFTPPERAAAG
jgi:hypothetical protein